MHPRKILSCNGIRGKIFPRYRIRRAPPRLRYRARKYGVMRVFYDAAGWRAARPAAPKRETLSKFRIDLLNENYFNRKMNAEHRKLFIRPAELRGRQVSAGVGAC
ncbi:hypothetical protein EVAR_48304_1 [Eumeta japonica]|uniref:Uncharacterized protein n=1 Tax=Eumeta variegata TaxID=151549 RepID=A0A4C1WKA7_EUMVA|nr:hypothetical protein EVAR_48304_1 [Eumeta japonica]